MGLYVLWLVALYLRPSEALTIRRGDLQRPVRGVARNWHLLLFPEERPDRSKVYAANDSIEFDCAWIPWLGVAAAAAAAGDPNELALPSHHPEVSKELRETATFLGPADLFYQARHSGPSIDAAGTT